MTIPADLLKAILERPLDNGPRLVAADALQEKGDPRGLFIVMQCRLMDRGVPRDERADLNAQVAALLKKHRASWAAAAKGVEHVMRRGFVDEVSGSADKLAKAPELFAEEPVTRLKISGVTPKGVAALASAGAFGRVLRLTLQGSLGKEGTRDLAAALAKRTSPLVSLNIGGTAIDGADLATLVGTLGGCRILALTGNPLGDEGARALAKAKTLASLDTLYLSETSLTDEGARELAKSPSLSALLRLALARNEDVTSEGLRALAKSKKLRRLRWLEYSDEDEGSQQIVTRAK